MVPDPSGREAAIGLKVVEKPWGREVWWAVTDRYVGKLIQVRGGNSLSLQYHRWKLESLFFRHGSGSFFLAGREIPITAGLAVTVIPGTIHKVTAHTDLEIYEVSTSEVDDVVRLQDNYGRADILQAGS